jgi:hypothetical protein
MRRGQWTDAEIAVLVEAVASKTHYRVVSELLGRSYPSVASMVNRLALRKTKAWTTQEMQRVKELRETGLGYVLIGRAVGRTTWAVRHALKRGAA